MESDYIDEVSNHKILNPKPQGKIFDCLQKLSTEAKELYLDSSVPRISYSEITPLSFYRRWVSPNKPVIIKSAFDHWPAMEKWDYEYLRSKIGGDEVTVTATPNGYADAPVDELFVLPEEQRMKFSQFLDVIEKETVPGSPVYYVQKQNSNLIDEFHSLLEDVDAEIWWASHALDRKPDAVNFWMGDGRAVTSMHKDNYENIYCVIRGYKDFILLPPTDTPWVPYRLYPPAKFKSTQGNFQIIPLKNTAHVPWIAIDPLNPDLETYPQYANASPVRCRVHAGEALFLPSTWFHHVSQSHGCIAVNFWYDMEYDVRFNYYQLLRNLTWKQMPES